MELEQSFKKLEKEIAPFKTAMSGAADSILDNEVSTYPIFVVYQIPAVDIGLPLVEHSGQSSSWAINASTLEEFATKQLIDADKVDDFKAIYKDPKLNLCLFVIHKIGATFVFIPRN